MNLIQMKCPNCHGDLEIEDDLDTFFCKYCGTKLYLDGQSKEVIDAKTRLKMADKELELEKERHRMELETKQAEFKDDAKRAIAAFAVFVIAALIMVLVFKLW
jgi:hypothetical protein